MVKSTSSAGLESMSRSPYTRNAFSCKHPSAETDRVLQAHRSAPATIADDRLSSSSPPAPSSSWAASTQTTTPTVTATTPETWTAVYLRPSIPNPRSMENTRFVFLTTRKCPKGMPLSMLLLLAHAVRNMRSTKARWYGGGMHGRRRYVPARGLFSRHVATYCRRVINCPHPGRRSFNFWRVRLERDDDATMPRKRRAAAEPPTADATAGCADDDDSSPSSRLRGSTLLWGTPREAASPSVVSLTSSNGSSRSLRVLRTSASCSSFDGMLCLRNEPGAGAADAPPLPPEPPRSAEFSMLCQVVLLRFNEGRRGLEFSSGHQATSRRTSGSANRARREEDERCTSFRETPLRDGGDCEFCRRRSVMVIPEPL
mmetsp:Transcript_5011/g.14385  ORF Transcript_5011/g.14385 Transcript_5011/m.14385 type:complete len:371 (-) Transcript_5011:66-1178(-)